MKAVLIFYVEVVRIRKFDEQYPLRSELQRARWRIIFISDVWSPIVRGFFRSVLKKRTHGNHSWSEGCQK